MLSWLKSFLNRTQPIRKIDEPASSNPSIEDEPLSGFGYKINWYMIPESELIAKNWTILDLANAMNVQEQQPMSWNDGVSFGYKYLNDKEKQIYISSAFDGWIYVIHSIESRLDLLDNVVANFYAFGSYRVVDFIAWKQVENSEIVRHFAYADGEVLVNIGSQTPEEKYLGFVDLSELSNVDATEAMFSDENIENDLIISMLDEDDVISICNDWTEKDPSRFNEVTIDVEDFPEIGIGGIIKTI
ncbi:hypothetical protein [Psychrobacter alimentarius]|uniref:hypothetical protein n=1 Tax=Psychrobacter alimentarius TaxID=261164 RepID=UPI003FD06FBA